MRKIFFLGHDATGDHITYNGLVRYLRNYYDVIYFVTYYTDLVNFLFNDDENIICVSPDTFNNSLNSNDEFDVIDARTNGEFFSDIKNIKNGIYYSYNNKLNDNLNQIVNSYSESYYTYLGLNVKLRLDNFHFNRDFEKEEIQFSKIPYEKYIVITEWESGWRPNELPAIIDKNYLKDKNIVNLHFFSEKLFDVCKIIEKADEIHFCESALSLFTYHMQYKNLMKRVPVFLHTYARQEPHRICSGPDCNNKILNHYFNPILDNWNIIYK